MTNQIHAFVADHKKRHPHLYRPEPVPAASETIDCRSYNGVTIGLIDGIIAMARIIATRDQLSPAVVEAIKDIRDDADVRNLMGLST